MVEENRKVIQEELIRVAKLMEETDDTAAKIFYYSACYAVTNRILNLGHDLGLNLIDMTLNTTYTMLQSRFLREISGPPPSYPLVPEIFERLPGLIKDLARQIGKGQPPTALEKIATLCYIATGNGYYMYKAGKLKLP